MVNWINERNVPWVQLADINEQKEQILGPHQVIRSNDEKIGILAAQHFVSLGFTNFGFAGFFVSGLVATPLCLFSKHS